MVEDLDTVGSKWEGFELPGSWGTAIRQIWRRGLVGFGGLVSISERSGKWPEILSGIWGRDWGSAIGLELGKKGV